MMAPAGAEEESTRVAPHHAVEADRLGEELGGAREIADVQVHVPDRGAGRHPAPRNHSRRPHQPCHVHRVRGHDAPAASPKMSGAVTPIRPSLGQADLLQEVLVVPEEPLVVHPPVRPVGDRRHPDREALAGGRNGPAVWASGG